MYNVEVEGENASKFNFQKKTPLISAKSSANISLVVSNEIHSCIDR